MSLRHVGSAPRHRAALTLLVLLAIPSAAPAEEPGSAAPDEGEGAGEAVAVDESSLTEGELDRLCRQLDDDDEESRRSAAARIVAAAPSSIETMRQRLSRELRAAPAQLLDVMNHAKRGEPAQRFPPVKREPFDMVEALVAVERPDDDADRRALREVLEVSALLRGLAEAEDSSAAAIVVRYGVRERGVFHAEVARNVRRMGDHAMPALIRTSRHPNERIASFATELLEWLQRSTAGLQVQLRDPAVLAEVLTIFGTTADRETIPVLLSFTASEHAEVREAARASVLRYGRAILWPTREKYESFTGEAPPRRWGWEELSRQLFEAQDQARLAQAHERMEAGLAHAAAFEHEEMLAAYRLILGRWPMYDRRREMVPGLVEYADHLLADDDRRQARTMLGRALLLEDDEAEAARLRSRLDLMNIEDDLARGVADGPSLDRLVEAEPDNARAAELRARVQQRTELPEPRRYRLIAAVGLSAFGLACLGLLIVRMLPAPRPRKQREDDDDSSS